MHIQKLSFEINIGIEFMPGCCFCSQIIAMSAFSCYFLGAQKQMVPRLKSRFQSGITKLKMAQRNNCGFY